MWNITLNTSFLKIFHGHCKHDLTSKFRQAVGTAQVTLLFEPKCLRDQQLSNIKFPKLNNGWKKSATLCDKSRGQAFDDGLLEEYSRYESLETRRI